MEELGINSGTNLNSTYINQANTVDELIQTHATTLADVFNIKLQQKEKNLPQIYWIPKLHKTPYKARFIAGSRSCTTTRLSKLITECLKLVRRHCTAYRKTIRERTGVNSMWIINNSLDVIRTLEEKQLSLTHVSTWDFSTLYTSLPHARLKNQLHDFLERVFHTKGKSFIATNSFRTFWTNDRTSMRYTYFSCRELCLTIDFLIDNIYVRFGNSVFRQVIGIPMGTNSAPLLADLFLHTFEYDFMVKTMKHDITKATSSATPFVTSTIYSVLTMWTLVITSAQFTRQNCNLLTLPHLLLKCVISTHISRQAIQPHLSVSASTIREMTLHSGLSTFLIWTATFPPIQLTVFIYLNW